MDQNILNQLIADKQFKAHVAYLKLARDCLAGNPLVSYWALYYVLEQGIKTPVQDDAFRRSLGTIMTCLEKEKTSRKGDPLFDIEQESRKFIENYANQLLVRAENDAELGASPSIAIKLYLASAQVSTLLTLFGDNSEENAKRIKYCKWKAVTIAKEVKQGGAGAGAGENADPENGIHGGNAAGGNDQPPPEYANQENDDDLFAPSNTNHSSGPAEPKPTPQPEEPAIDFANLSLSDSDIKKAELFCESALYAIRSNDILSAVTSIRQTLAVLQKCARNNAHN